MHMSTYSQHRQNVFGINDEFALDLDAYVDHPPEIPEGVKGEIWQ